MNPAFTPADRQRVFERILLGIERDAAETDSARWLRQNEAGIARIRAEREAERQQEQSR